MIASSFAGLGDSSSAFPARPFSASAPGNGGFLIGMFGHMLEYSRLTSSHCSVACGSESATIASAGHSGTQTPQSMHSSGLMTSYIFTLVEAVYGTDFHAVRVFALDAIFSNDVRHKIPGQGVYLATSIFP